MSYISYISDLCQVFYALNLFYSRPSQTLQSKLYSSYFTFEKFEIQNQDYAELNLNMDVAALKKSNHLWFSLIPTGQYLTRIPNMELLPEYLTRVASHVFYVPDIVLS